MAPLASPLAVLSDDELTCIVRKVRVAELAALAATCHRLHQLVAPINLIALEELDLHGLPLAAIRGLGTKIASSDSVSLRRIFLPNDDGTIDVQRLLEMLKLTQHTTDKKINLVDHDLSGDLLDTEARCAAWNVSNESWAAYCALLVPLARAHGLVSIELRTWEHPPFGVTEEEDARLPRVYEIQLPRSYTRGEDRIVQYPQMGHDQGLPHLWDEEGTRRLYRGFDLERDRKLRSCACVLLGELLLASAPDLSSLNLGGMNLKESELIGMVSIIHDVGAPKLKNIDVHSEQITMRSYEAIGNLLSSGKAPAVESINAWEAGCVDDGMMALIRSLRSPQAALVRELTGYPFEDYASLATELRAWPASLTRLEFPIIDYINGRDFESFAAVLCATPPPATYPLVLEVATESSGHRLAHLLSSSTSTHIIYEFSFQSMDVDFLSAVLRAGGAPMLQCITLEPETAIDIEALQTLQGALQRDEWPTRVHFNLLPATLESSHLYGDPLVNVEALSEVLAVCEAKRVSLCGAAGATKAERMRSLLSNIRNVVANQGLAWLQEACHMALIKSSIKIFVRTELESTLQGATAAQLEEQIESFVPDCIQTILDGLTDV